MLVIPDIKLKKEKKKKTTVCFKVFNVFRSMCCEVIWNLKFFLSNCTAPIYCNVIKNSYCEFLSQFALSPRISASHLCNGISCELHEFGSYSPFISCTSRCLSQSGCLCPLVFPSCERGAAALWQNTLLSWSIPSGPCGFSVLCRAEPHSLVLTAWLHHLQPCPRDLVLISLTADLMWISPQV